MNQTVTISRHGPTGYHIDDLEVNVTGVQFENGTVTIRMPGGDAVSKIEDLANPNNWQSTTLSILNELNQKDLTLEETAIIENIKGTVHRIFENEVRKSYRPPGWIS